MLRIESQNNATVKEIRSLKEQKFREKTGLFFIEGIRIVEDLFKSNSNNHNDSLLKYLVMSETFYNSSDFVTVDIYCRALESTRIILLPDGIFATLTDTKTPQGILAVLQQPIYEIPDFSKNNALYLLLDRIQDPGNMGTILRTADAANVDAVFISSGSVDLFNPKVIRSTMGSIFHFPIFPYADLLEIINNLKRCGGNVVSADLSAKNSLFETDISGKIGIVIGNEANGISDEIVASSDTLVKIPIPGKAESLNASVAAGILIYESLRQRHHKSDSLYFYP